MKTFFHKIQTIDNKTYVFYLVVIFVIVAMSTFFWGVLGNYILFHNEIDDFCKQNGYKESRPLSEQIFVCNNIEIECNSSGKCLTTNNEKLFLFNELI